MATAIETPDGPRFTSVVHECCTEVQNLRVRIEKALARCHTIPLTDERLHQFAADIIDDLSEEN